MKVFLDENVYEAALNRIRYLMGKFDCFVSFSGGKDSTVTLELALIVAREMDKLPLKVMFLDQEAEYEAVIDYVREVMNRPEVDPRWYQIKFRLFNSNSMEDDWLVCWDDAKEDIWMRPKEDIAIKENTLGVDRFKDVLTQITLQDFPENTVCLAGVRAQESPARLFGLTGSEAVDGLTWGKRVDTKTNRYVMYPLYDWAYSDIWKAILDNGWTYCSVYDKMYRLGTSLNKMRVSSLCHEISSDSLGTLQEFEKETWNKLTIRLGGIATAGNHKWTLRSPSKLPFMFNSWKEYRDYLAENILTGDSKKKVIAKFKSFDKMKFDGKDFAEDVAYYKCCIDTVLSNDHYFTKLDMYRTKSTNFSRGKNNK